MVGAVDLGVSRKAMYMKELSLVLSRSYGPGRYDSQYEEEGHDYPIGYVRWTEKRNMEAFLDLLASGAIEVAPFLERRCPVEQGSAAYQELKSTGAYTVLLEYPGRVLIPMPVATGAAARAARAPSAGELQSELHRRGEFRARGYFSSPAKDTRRGPALGRDRLGRWHRNPRAGCLALARAVAPADLLQDKDTDAVFVLSRHDSHAQYVVAALSGHKPVLVEKPLAVNREQLEEIRMRLSGGARNSPAPFLMVGYNRRFAPFTEKLRAILRGPSGAHGGEYPGERRIHPSRSLGAAEQQRRRQDRG